MKTIGLSAPIKSSGLMRMLNALGELLNIRFEERTFGNDVGIDAWILNETDWEAEHRIAHCNYPCYSIIRGDQLVPCGERSVVEFSKHHTLPSVLSGRQVRTEEAVKVMALPHRRGDMVVVASKAGAPIWVLKEAGAHYHHFVALPIPELNDGEPLFQHFQGSQFLQLLPLFLFLRALGDANCWTPPPLQACFMFDDPNLHWPTYGFINFAEILQHSQVHNYHVSFATIPLDAWFIHMPTASLFKQHSDRLSLLIHGNDHIIEELGRAYSDREQSRILLQALGRIGELERHSGLEVPRVMAPPHGACREDVLREMARLGFEACSISRWSLRHYNRQASWLCSLGMRPSDIIAGLPVFPRFRISRTCHNSILIAALLDQPIIPVGHHHDVAEGLQLLGDLSEFVNSLGTVQWANMKRISRSHYARRIDGRILNVRMFTKHIEIRIPEGINKVLVYRSWLKGTESEPLAWRTLSNGAEWKPHHLPEEPITVTSGEKIEIVSEPSTPVVIDLMNFRKFHFWPMVRRQLTEVRDRIAPILKRVSTFPIKKRIF